MINFGSGPPYAIIFNLQVHFILECFSPKLALVIPVRVVFLFAPGVSDLDESLTVAEFFSLDNSVCVFVGDAVGI